MKISIVIPSLNQARYLEACLQSVLWQETPGVQAEALVYDGGSTDGSPEIIAGYASRLSYWQSEPDGGQAFALRSGFERATGDILGWLNSDDLLLPGALGNIVSWFQENNDCVMVYGDAVWIDAIGSVLRAKREIPFDWNIFAYGYCYLPQPSTFFRRTAYLGVGGIDVRLECCMDYDLWHRLVKLGPVGHLRKLLSAIRIHPETKTQRLRATFAREHAILRQRYLRCGRARYAVRHAFQRARRVLKKMRAGAYLPLTPDEVRRCGLKGC